MKYLLIFILVCLQTSAYAYQDSTLLLKKKLGISDSKERISTDEFSSKQEALSALAYLFEQGVDLSSVKQIYTQFNLLDEYFFQYLPNVSQLWLSINSDKYKKIEIYVPKKIEYLLINARPLSDDTHDHSEANVLNLSFEENSQCRSIALYHVMLQKETLQSVSKLNLKRFEIDRVGFIDNPQVNLLPFDVDSLYLTTDDMSNKQQLNKILEYVAPLKLLYINQVNLKKEKLIESRVFKNAKQLETFILMGSAKIALHLATMEHLKHLYIDAQTDSVFIPFGKYVHSLQNIRIGFKHLSFDNLVLESITDLKQLVLTQNWAEPIEYRGSCLAVNNLYRNISRSISLGLMSAWDHHTYPFDDRSVEHKIAQMILRSPQINKLVIHVLQFIDLTEIGNNLSNFSLLKHLAMTRVLINRFPISALQIDGEEKEISLQDCIIEKFTVDFESFKKNTSSQIFMEFSGEIPKLPRKLIRVKNRFDYVSAPSPLILNKFYKDIADDFVCADLLFFSSKYMFFSIRKSMATGRILRYTFSLLPTHHSVFFKNTTDKKKFTLYMSSKSISIFHKMRKFAIYLVKSSIKSAAVVNYYSFLETNEFNQYPQIARAPRKRPLFGLD